MSRLQLRFSSALFVSVPLALALTFDAATARADVTPPAEEACGSTEGAKCRYLNSGAGYVSGTCEKAKCSHFDYPNWDRDASAMPPKVEYDCLTCKGTPEPAADASTDDAGGCSHGTSWPSSLPLTFVPLGLAYIFARRRRRA